MKKKVILWIVVVLCILLISICLFLLLKKSKKEQTVYVPLVNETTKEVSKKIASVEDVSDLDIVIRTPLGYVFEKENGTTRGFITNSGDVIVQPASGRRITYNNVNDCYLITDNKNKTLFCENIDENHKVFKTTSTVMERETEDRNVYYIISDNKYKVYYYGYIDGLEIEDNIGLRVFDNYVVQGKNFYEASKGLIDEDVTIENINSKYIVVDGKKNVYLYNLQEHKMDKYKEYSAENGYYVFDDKYYIGFDGEEIQKNGKKHRVINEHAYIDFSECEKGFSVYVNDKAINDVCYSKIDILDNVAYIGDDYYKVVVFNNGEYINTDYHYRKFGSIVKETKGTDLVYYKDGKQLDNQCSGHLMDYLEDVFICVETQSNNYYFVNSDLKKISDNYRKIECYEDDVCYVYDGKKYGLAYKGKLLTDIAYYDVEYIRNDLFRLGRPIKDVLVSIEDGNSDSTYKYQEYKIDLDVDKVINDYKLESIKKYIDADRDLFKRYAYTIINNKNMETYRDKSLLMYSVVYENKDLMDEYYFLNNLSQLRVKVLNKLQDNIAAGLYYDNDLLIEILKGYSGSYYHEFVHFLDHRMNRNYNYKGICYNNGKYTLDDNTLCNRYDPIYTSVFITEAGAETNTHRYFNKGALTYIEGTNLYNLFAIILGEDVMDDVFFAETSEEKFFYELSKLGISHEEYSEFIKTANLLTDAHTGYKVEDIAAMIKFVNIVYQLKYGHDWSEDSRFILCMSAFLSSYYPDGIERIFKNYLTAKEIAALKKVSIDSISKSVNIPGVLPNYIYTLINGKDYLTVRCYGKKNVEYVMIEINPKTLKGKVYKEYKYER